jgi:hypothetical protein
LSVITKELNSPFALFQAQRRRPGDFGAVIRPRLTVLAGNCNFAP